MNIENASLNQALLKRFQSVTGLDPLAQERHYKEVMGSLNAVPWWFFVALLVVACIDIAALGLYIQGGSGAASSVPPGFRSMAEAGLILAPIAGSFFLFYKLTARKLSERDGIRGEIEKLTQDSRAFLEELRKLPSLFGKDIRLTPFGHLVTLAKNQLENRAIGLNETWTNDPGMFVVGGAGCERMKKFMEAYRCFFTLRLVEGTYHRFFKVQKPEVTAP